MESNSINPQTETADARGNAGQQYSDSAWSDSREPGQRGQTSQTGDGAGAAMRRAGEDADNFVRKAADSTQDYLQSAIAKASAAAQTGKAYAHDAVNAAGKRIDSMKGQAADLRERGLQFAAAEPLKAVAFAAAGSAVVTAVLLSFMRGRR